MIVGVSGGRDSVALLQFLVGQGWRKIIVAHLNHGLRGRESGQDAAFVRRLASRYGLQCRVDRVDVAALAESSGKSVETAARMAREEFFQRLAAECQTPFVFLAHHLEDNAETIIGNLFRGAGSGGVSGMKTATVTNAGWVKLRPLLTVHRAEIDGYVRVRKLSFREDSSNAFPGHRRNRLRHEVMPLLDAVFLRDTASLVVRHGALAGRDDDCLNAVALEFMRAERLLQEDGSLRIIAAMNSTHPAIMSRVLKHWLTRELKTPGIGHREIEAALHMLSPGGSPRLNLPGGRILRRKARRLWVS